MSKLAALPVGVVRKLCQHLNMEGAGVKNWSDLITHVKDPPYDLFAHAAFLHNGMRPYTSPADQVMADFIARGITVDQLYSMLGEMDAWGCMAVLEEHVTPALVNEMRQRREEQRSGWTLQLDPTKTPPNDSTPSPEEHPEFGVLPARPPPSPEPPETVTTKTTPPTHSAAWTHSTASSVSNHPQQQVPQDVLSQPSKHGYSSSTNYPPFPRAYPSHVTASTSNSSVFTYGSSSSTSGSVTLPSTQATPTNSYTTSNGSHALPSSSSWESEASSGGGLNILHFSYAELSEATGGFTEGLVGLGAFGTVFRAKVRGNGPYAIKKLHTEAEMGVHCGQFYEAFHRETFSQELQLLTRYHHRNILSLVAHSNDGYRPCLVYEFMENGSLAECLEGKRGVRLGWQLRLSIATQIAEALQFLHTVNHPTSLVHGDIKSANILLDVHFVPKLSDFGLARELTTKPNSRSTISTARSNVVMGTMAYMAPEFLRNKKLTTRTDVYAFGVVMLELFTGEPAFSSDPTLQERVLTDRLSELLEDSELHRGEVLMSADPGAGWPQETALGLFDIITVCLQSKQRRRLPIEQVLDQLVVLPS